MKILVGSKNPTKVEAVRELLQDYPHLMDAEVEGVEISSGVSEQPLSFAEVMLGASNRAKSAKEGADYGIGLEAGFIEVPLSKSGYMNISACAIYDGENTHMGFSSGFETPNPETMRLVIEEGLDLSEASVRTGLVDTILHSKLNGVVGALTRGVVNRKVYIQQSLRMALMHLEPTA